MKIILDTSFILTCLKQKIDFFEELVGEEILIPIQVINEIKRFDNKLALKLLGKNKFQKIDLGKTHTDKLIIKFAKENPKVIVATLDKEIKNKTKNQKLIIRGKKNLEIV